MHQAKYTTLSAGWANLVFALVTVTLLGGSTLISTLGFPALAVLYNQGIIIGAAALLAWRGRWSWREVFRLKKTRAGYIWLAVAAGISAWWFNAGILVTIQRWLDRVLGPMPDLAPDFGPWGILAVLFATLFLAPLGEEILFRGYIQRAYEDYCPRGAWVFSGLLFGLLHVGNSLSSVITASFLGLVLGYVVWRADSLLPAIIGHFAINLTALVFALPIHGALTQTGTPWWVAIASLAGLVALGFFLKQINRLAQEDQGQPGEEAAEAQFQGDSRRDSWALRIVPLVVALLVLALPASGEVAVRMGLVDLTLQRGENSLSRDRVEGETDLAKIQIDSLGTLNFSYTIASNDIHAAMEIVAPDGRIMWRQRWQEEGLVGSSESFSLEVDQVGLWLVRLTGIAEELDLSISWMVRRK